MYQGISQSETFKYALFVARNLLIEDDAQYATLCRILQTERLTIPAPIRDAIVEINVRYEHSFLATTEPLERKPPTIMEALFGDKEPTFIVYGLEDAETIHLAASLLGLNEVYPTGTINYPHSVTFSEDRAFIHKGVMDNAIQYPYLDIERVVWKYLTSSYPTLLLNWEEHPTTPEFINCDSTLFGVYDYDATDDRYVYRCTETEWQHTPRTPNEPYPKHLFHIIFNTLGSEYVVHTAQQYINMFRLHSLFEARHNDRTRSYPMVNYSNFQNRVALDVYKLGIKIPYRTIYYAFTVNNSIIKTYGVRATTSEELSLTHFPTLPILEYLSDTSAALDLHDLKSGDTVLLRNGRSYPINVEHDSIGNYSFMEYHDNGFHVEDYALDIVSVNGIKNKYIRSEPIAKRKKATRSTTK